MIKREPIEDNAMSDVKNMDHLNCRPGMYTSYDLTLFYPSGMLP